MIDVNKVEENFNNYVRKFEQTNPKIIIKKFHSIRVKEISEKIARGLNLSEEEIQIAMVIGLLHDIGRFEQEAQYHTFNDFKSMDHGDYGAEYLKNNIREYIETDIYDNIIINAVKNHNKFLIEDKENEKENLFAKIVRDADKLDIMYESINIFYKGKEDLINNAYVSDYVYSHIKKNQLVKSDKNIVIDYLDNIIRTISFVFDLNFDISFRILKENNYINNLIERFEYKNEETKKRMDEIKLIVNDFIKQKYNN
ncbi:MAG: HD domain-containing protein [Clostridiales bacterium]|nr:HD domain-containing protein [Clostridiales bacterium]